jgi:Flp pilus assembly protein TadB
VLTCWLALAACAFVWPSRTPVHVGEGHASGADPSIALVLDLAAAALRSGHPVSVALARAAPAAEPSLAAALDRVARLANLGADAAQAWAELPAVGPLGEVRRAAIRSASSGVRMAASFERLAGEIRADRAAAAAARAQRAGVHAIGPLAACFLPAFVCLGIVPVVVGVARSAVGVLP